MSNKWFEWEQPTNPGVDIKGTFDYSRDHNQEPGTVERVDILVIDTSNGDHAHVSIDVNTAEATVHHN